MTLLTRWLAPAALAAGLGVAALTPAPARASDDLARVIVDVADVVLRGGTPYYRHGGHGYNDRLIVVRDRYGRPVYYRQVPRHYQASHSRHYRSGPPAHAPAHGYRDRNRNDNRNVRCNRNGHCTAQYYDPRYDRDRNRYQTRWDRDRNRHQARWDRRR
ncbi:hypothetical protein H0E84_04560 [Luteimonas sp. SJ-92]|uniref:Uncharacterized protein n=1 Tax=Luteimonas salinisoli TaxID=2752307 RepID=A0A853J9W5_9GAMM|nr:hypothetical protein [Luteimonas salinisoli]NZA25645.1 hypothetical protein [Luteimonas salinisoli]